MVGLRRSQTIGRGAGNRRTQVLTVKRVLRCVCRQLRCLDLIFEASPAAVVRLLDLLGVQGTLDCVFDRLLSMVLLDLDQLLAPLRLAKVFLQALPTALRVVLLAERSRHALGLHRRLHALLPVAGADHGLDVEWLIHLLLLLLVDLLKIGTGAGADGAQVPGQYDRVLRHSRALRDLVRPCKV